MIRHRIRPLALRALRLQEGVSWVPGSTNSSPTNVARHVRRATARAASPSQRPQDCSSNWQRGIVGHTAAEIPSRPTRSGPSPPIG